MAPGERVGAPMASGDVLAAGVVTRNANVGSGEGEGVPEADGEGDNVPLGDVEELGVGLGVGDEIIFSH